MLRLSHTQKHTKNIFCDQSKVHKRKYTFFFFIYFRAILVKIVFHFFWTKQEYYVRLIKNENVNCDHIHCEFLVGYVDRFHGPKPLMVATQSHILTRHPNIEKKTHQTSLIYLNPSCGKKSDLKQHKRSMFPVKRCCLGLLQLLFRPVAYSSVRAQCVPPVQFDPFMPFQFIAGKKSDLHRWMLKLLYCKRQESQARTHSARACSISSPFSFDFYFSYEYTSFLVAGILGKFRQH